MAEYDLRRVRDIVTDLRGAGLDVWLFGGWAEELRGLRAPGPHADIDLLLRGSAFDALEIFLAERGMPDIAAKRFSHKRAFQWRGVRVEVVLVQLGSNRSQLFDGRAVIDWPSDTFAEHSREGLPIASAAALDHYRRNHRRVTRAYAAFGSRSSARERLGL